MNHQYGTVYLKLGKAVVRLKGGDPSIFGRVALVRYGTLHDQETLIGTLRDVVEKLSWFEKQPLLSMGV